MSRASIHRVRVAPLLAALALACAGGLGACAEDAGDEVVAADGRVDLAPRFDRAGLGVYEHTLASFDRQFVPIAGTTEVSATVTRRFATEPVEEREEGGAIVSFQMRHVRFHIEPAQRPVYDFDSETNRGADDDRIAEALRGLAELEFRAALDERGKVVELLGFGEALRQLRQPPERVISLFDRSWFIAALETVWSAVPKGEETMHAVGDSWQEYSTSTVPGGSAEATTTITHTLARVEDQTAYIEGSGEMVIEWGVDPMTRGSDSRIDDQAFAFTTAWSLRRGNLESHELESMIIYFVDHGEGLSQTVERRLNASMRRIEPGAAD